MQLAITARAAAALLELQIEHNPANHQVLRLAADAEGMLLFTLDSRRNQDQVVEYRGKTVLVIALLVNADLAGCTLDWKGAPTGVSFSFSRDEEQHGSAEIY